jgi:hypothetical protein
LIFFEKSKRIIIPTPKKTTGSNKNSKSKWFILLKVPNMMHIKASSKRAASFSINPFIFRDGLTTRANFPTAITEPTVAKMSPIGMKPFEKTMISCL